LKGDFRLESKFALPANPAVIGHRFNNGAYGSSFGGFIEIR
jgi:hypothetical protein